jgi:hypothetical protein
MDGGGECEVGHAHDPAALAVVMADSVRGSMWLAIRALEEEVSRARWLQERQRDDAGGGAAMVRRAEEAQAAADELRNVLKIWDGAARN